MRCGFSSGISTGPQRKTDGGDGGKVGRVLGGKPIRDSEIARDLQCTKRTACTWRQRLQKQGYITTKRTPYGYTVRVLKSKKWLRGNSANLPIASGKNSASLARDVGNIPPKDVPSASQTGKQTDNLIKRTQDNTGINTKTIQPADADGLVGRLALLFREKTGRHLGSNRGQCAKIAALAKDHGESDVIASFERWLGRSQGMEGIKWPQAVFIREYVNYSPQEQKRLDTERSAREQEERRARLARDEEERQHRERERQRQNELERQFMERDCPSCGVNGDFVRSLGYVLCRRCNSAFNIELKPDSTDLIVRKAPPDMQEFVRKATTRIEAGKTASHSSSSSSIEQESAKITGKPLPPITKEEEEQNAERVWAQLMQEPGGAEILADWERHCQPSTGRVPKGG